MTANACLRGLTNRIHEVWPERPVYWDEIGQGTPGTCLVRCVSEGHRKELGRRRKRTFGLEIVWFAEAPSALGFHDWAERLYEACETLDADGGLVHGSSMTARDGGNGTWYFAFAVIVRPRLETESAEVMGSLELTESVGTDGAKLHC